MQQYFFTILICFNFIIVPNNSSDHFNHQYPTVFPELSQTIHSEIQDLKLTPDQLHFLTIIYETLLCRKLQKHYPFSSFFLSLIGAHEKKIDQAFAKCNNHVHLKNSDHLAPFDTIPNKSWIAKKYFESHGLTSEIVHTYQQAFHHACKKEVFSNENSAK